MHSSAIVNAILDGNFNATELKAINNAVKYAWRHDQVKQAQKFRIGQSVKFMGKYGITVSGTIEKINSKTISVNATDGRKWRVPPGLLNVA